MDSHLRKMFMVMMALGCWSSVLYGDTTPDTAKEIRPDPVVQDKLDKFLRRAPQTSNDIDAQNEKKKFDEEWDNLKKSLGAKLIPELAFYELSIDNRRDFHVANEKLKLMILTDHFLFELVHDWKKSEVMTAIEPYLHSEYKNRKIRRRLSKVMDRTLTDLKDSCDNCRLQTFSYGPIFTYIRVNNREIPVGIVDYIFESSPRDALLGFANDTWNLHAKIKPILLAEHEINDTLWKHRRGFLGVTQIETGALEHLQKLSLREEWWARRYVVEIMRQHHGFRQPEIIERLKQDKHPIVRAAIHLNEESVKAQKLADAEASAKAKKEAENHPLTWRGRKIAPEQKNADDHPDRSGDDNNAQ